MRQKKPSQRVHSKETRQDKTRMEEVVVEEKEEEEEGKEEERRRRKRKKRRKDHLPWSCTALPWTTTKLATLSKIKQGVANTHAKGDGAASIIPLERERGNKAKKKMFNKEKEKTDEKQHDQKRQKNDKKVEGNGEEEGGDGKGEGGGRR